MKLETRQKLSESLKNGFKNGRKPHNLGKRASLATREKISKTRRLKYGTNASINRQIRNISQYKQWRTEIFKRDNYTCCLCGANSANKRRRVYLNVHHKIELSQIIKNKSFEDAIKMPQLWDKENVITVCVDCHKNIHRTLNLFK